MSVFAGPYPARLHEVVKHAERFCVLLGEAWAMTEDGRLWLVGRQEEVELVVRCMIEDWRAGDVDEAAAASSVGAYLRALHIGARGVLEAGDAFACCSDGGAATAPPVDLGAVTRCLPPLVDGPRARDTIAVCGNDALAEWLAREAGVAVHEGEEQGDVRRHRGSVPASGAPEECVGGAEALRVDSEGRGDRSSP